MTIIEIAALSNGAHRNQTGAESCPDGWAEVPDCWLDAWEACSPFADVTVENGPDGWCIVTDIVPRSAPVEPEPEVVPDTIVQPDELTDYTPVYAGLVVSGTISITDVPAQYRAEVQRVVIQNLKGE